MSKHSNLCATKSKEKTMTNVMLKTALLILVICFIGLQLLVIYQVNDMGGGSLRDFIILSVLPILTYVSATMLVKGK